MIVSSIPVDCGKVRLEVSVKFALGNCHRVAGHHCIWLKVKKQKGLSRLSAW